MNNMNIAFFGSPRLAAACLTELIHAFQVKLVVTQPDREAGRGRRIAGTLVNDIAVKEKITVSKPRQIDKTLIDKTLFETLNSLRINLIVVVAYGKILPEEIISLPEYGCLNLHGSLLPKYRGPSPIQSALLNGERITGITVQVMKNEMDAGDVISQEEIPVNPEWTAEDLMNEIIGRAPFFLVKTIKNYLSETITPQLQRESEVTYCSKIRKEDGFIDWHESSEAILNKVKAFNLWPVSFTYLDGNVLRIYRAHIHSVKSIVPDEPGKIAALDKSKGIVVQTGKGMISILELQLENKKRMNYRDFMNGYRNLEGKVLGPGTV